MIGHNEAKPLGLRRGQLRKLEAFLRSLDAPPATAPEWLVAPPSVPVAETAALARGARSCTVGTPSPWAC